MCIVSELQNTRNIKTRRHKWRHIPIINDTRLFSKLQSNPTAWATFMTEEYTCSLEGISMLGYCVILNILTFGSSSLSSYHRQQIHRLTTPHFIKHWRSTTALYIRTSELQIVHGREEVTDCTIAGIPRSQSQFSSYPSCLARQRSTLHSP